MKNMGIKIFEIKNLFYQFDVKLPLDEKINIFLGENGMGKTTILNCLHCVLSGNIEKLNSIVFDEIVITLTDNNTLCIKHCDISAYVDEYLYDTPRRRRVNLDIIFSKKELEEIRDIVVHNYDDIDIYNKYCFRISEAYGVPFSIARRELERYAMRYSSHDGDFKKALSFKKKVGEIFDKEILYFPTYRRIEEDMSKLGIDAEKDRVKDRLIQFGMTDVEKAIEKILSTIRSAAITGFTEMTGVLLKQYLGGELRTDNLYNIDSDKLTIALDRIGDKIESYDKERIKALVANSKIYEPENIYLLNLIKNLIISYEKQNQYDERVKKFVSVCNGYLNGKKYIYDESNVQLAICREKTNTPISVQNLSSGEKQVISIFSKLYIEETEDCIILFDEPELSLSITWQAKFLPDIMDSKKCSTLIAVTHSPFIFENEFDALAQDMGECILENN